mmetsp:Transcript_59508/g.94506  ORF Transcript_59508/g.94506 Transcript_59508/m.94506 type:complete len:140 (-) Transcript_59508:50-469(-)|eukprot:CAMPEP_0169133064 /NCGR_PEP_ID=MMETSP1015-20121227/39112_1 /TAXON_ID=342587 /ORGANISM="Karlodinium micrum, Strain CCMP2283" /LENGTH=139 /DNA_ID=CAMNT_0009197429 /DNA_START=45 /DNA_END=464 /DNA_ORIENTATION=+
MKACVAVPCAVFALLAGLGNAAFLEKANATIPITEKVIVEGTEVYSQSAGHAQLNQCTSFAPSFVKDETKPSITVCGTMTKVTVYLLNECDKYSKYQLDIGTCDTSAPSTTCVTQSPATTQWLMTAQSYEIKQCATGTQ